MLKDNNNIDSFNGLFTSFSKNIELIIIQITIPSSHPTHKKHIYRNSDTAWYTFFIENNTKVIRENKYGLIKLKQRYKICGSKLSLLLKIFNLIAAKILIIILINIKSDEFYDCCVILTIGFSIFTISVSKGKSYLSFIAIPFEYCNEGNIE